MDSSREGKLLVMELTFKTEFTIGSGVIELKNTPDAHSLQIDKVTHITIRNPDITEHYQIPGKISSRGPARHHKSINHHSDPFDYSGVFLNMFIPDTFNVDVETADYVMTVSRMLPQGRAVALAKSIAQDMGLEIKQSPGNFAAYKAAFEVVK
jgi:hypothetical protein